VRACSARAATAARSAASAAPRAVAESAWLARRSTAWGTRGSASGSGSHPQNRDGNATRRAEAEAPHLAVARARGAPQLVRRVVELRLGAARKSRSGPVPRRAEVTKRAHHSNNPPTKLPFPLRVPLRYARGAHLERRARALGLVRAVPRRPAQRDAA
jgi:hypothetical protein